MTTEIITELREFGRKLILDLNLTKKNVAVV